MNFADFLDRRYLAWQLSEGGRRTIAEFAGYLEFPQTTVSSWMNGERTPRDEGHISRLAGKLGLEVYDVLGLPRPNEYLFSVAKDWKYVPEKRQREIADEVTGYVNGAETERTGKRKAARSNR